MHICTHFCYIHKYTHPISSVSLENLTDTQGNREKGTSLYKAVFSCCKPMWTMGDQPIVKLKDISQNSYHQQFWVARCAGCTPTGLPFPELEKFQGRKPKTSICPLVSRLSAKKRLKSMKLNIGNQQRKINKTKRWFFEEINKINKPLARKNFF